MADFTANLSAPQGAGASPVAPVQEQAINTTPMQAIGGIVEMFSKGLADVNKQRALERKNAVVGEYVRNEAVYSDALTTGQWGASQVGAASRANYQKMTTAYPEYMSDLMEAKRSVFDGTEVGEAQKKVDADLKFKQEEKSRASAAGYTFFDGMSPSTEAATIAASQTTIRLNQEFDAVVKRKAEERAVASEGRAEQTHVQLMQDHVDKDNAVKGLLEIADRNFDSLNGVGKDLLAHPTMSFEEKAATYSANVQRIKTGLLAISAKNPELAAPWQKLVDEMDSTFTKLADPKPKAEGELALLKAQFDAQQYKAKLLVTADPKNRAAVAVASLFPNNPQVSVSASPIISGILSQYGLNEPNKKNTPVVGTPDESGALKAVKGALNLLQSGKANGDPVKNGVEAVNTVNEILKQTGQMETGITPNSLKGLSTFYSSPEFGKLSAEGKIDMPSMQNAKKVFQVSYEPAVKDAILKRLEEVITPSVGRDGGGRGQPSYKVIDRVSIKFSGAGVVFEDKGKQSTTLGESISRKGLDEAATGLNTLIKIGAHMEGSTDYQKYWESNKHLLMPTVFPDPVKLQVGQTVKAKNGKSYKYLGGDYNDISNSYMELPNEPSK